MGDSTKSGSHAFGELLRRAREQIGLSRKELAERTDLSYPYISQLETAYRHPSSAAIAKLVDVLPLTLDDVYAAMRAPTGSDPAPADASVQHRASRVDERWTPNPGYGGAGAPAQLAAPTSTPTPAARLAARFAALATAAAAHQAPPTLTAAASPTPAPPAAPAQAAAAYQAPPPAPRSVSRLEVAKNIADLLDGLPADDQIEVMALVQSRVLRRALSRGDGREHRG